MIHISTGADCISRWDWADDISSQLVFWHYSENTCKSPPIGERRNSTTLTSSTNLSLQETVKILTFPKTTNSNRALQTGHRVEDLANVWLSELCGVTEGWSLFMIRINLVLKPDPRGRISHVQGKHYNTLASSEWRNYETIPQLPQLFSFRLLLLAINCTWHSVYVFLTPDIPSSNTSLKYLAPDLPGSWHAWNTGFLAYLTPGIPDLTWHTWFLTYLEYLTYLVPGIPEPWHAWPLTYLAQCAYSRLVFPVLSTACKDKSRKE